MFGELGLREDSCGDCEGTRAEGSGACDVVGRVAEDPYVLRRKVVPEFAGALKGDGAEFVALVVVVGVCAKREVLPDSVVREFVPRSGDDVAGEQRLHDVAAP